MSSSSNWEGKGGTRSKNTNPCTYCRSSSRKLRCDGDGVNPCTKCNDKGIPCEYPAKHGKFKEYKAGGSSRSHNHSHHTVTTIILDMRSASESSAHQDDVAHRVSKMAYDNLQDASPMVEPLTTNDNGNYEDSSVTWSASHFNDNNHAQQPENTEPSDTQADTTRNEESERRERRRARRRRDNEEYAEASRVGHDAFVERDRKQRKRH
ncbi:hypothetical protein SCHPADRAFT_484600 [Schizopora paradoxa]|uniref:Zn(2)-C6 fungal-type domain-containing protein n=1 Tax=Schizopora paradoxa TaxID=27342 RepID=A0A0H2S2C7_9AGAM|nr:hypothetical protein SCHPADRAFT_484600 [Schizopora paradoxa]